LPLLKELSVQRYRLPALFLALVVLSASLLTPVVSEAQEQTVTTRKPLQGNVEHDEKLPSLPEQYKVGTELNVNELTSLTPGNIWFPIPKWMAGKWHSQSSTVTSLQDCKRGVTEKAHFVRKEVVDVVYGSQTDKTGQIWEYIKVPRVQKIAIDGGGTAYLRVTREDVIQSDASNVLLKFLENQLIFFFSAVSSQMWICPSKRIVNG